MKVLFIWDVPHELKEYFKQNITTNAIKLVFTDNDSTYIKEVVDSDVVVGWKPTEELLNNAKQLKLFINPGAGVQHLIDIFKQFPKINVVNGHGNAFFTAQHIIAMLLNLTNQLIPHHQWMKEGKWRLGDKEAKSIPLNSRVIGLLGYGHVNQKVHQLLKPFGSKIKILRRNADSDQYGPKDINTFLEEIDTLLIALPLTFNTENLIQKQQLELLGKNGLLINAGRGKIVNEEDLFNALKNKTIMAAGIDVWYNYNVEPNEENKTYPYTFPFYQLENILLSPHRAASPFDDLKRWNDVIENINRLYKRNKPLLNKIDFKEGY